LEFANAAIPTPPSYPEEPSRQIGLFLLFGGDGIPIDGRGEPDDSSYSHILSIKDHGLPLVSLSSHKEGLLKGDDLWRRGGLGSDESGLSEERSQGE
jgi:hypothetical protein